MLSGLSPCRPPLCFRYTSVLSGPPVSHYQPWVRVNRGRRCQICHPCAALGHMIPLPHLVLSPRRSAGYTQKRLTENLKVPYYVGEQFSKEFSGVNLKNLERTVEDDYISNLRNNCWKEKQQSTFARKTNCAYLFVYLTMNIDCCFCRCLSGEMIKDTFRFSWPLMYVFMNCCCCFPQRKACFTELAILETLICTRERRGLALQAAPSCPRSQLHYTVEAAFIIKSKFFWHFSHSWTQFVGTTCIISFHKVNFFSSSSCLQVSRINTKDYWL